ncbi:aliphatic sulfonates import ATP-binding protein SsuB [Clostridium chromiireducens]|uniref:Aliphatic sulfonates import ATP-binding protein SsuB n=2 Tax=Clostridium chromiireducens TaxID=225345 RepID=A0A1V4I549_9CLOT|nr:aliphatic sulfonates import ATP-binding protein SsuB [Clostridium chromiireducens]
MAKGVVKMIEEDSKQFGSISVKNVYRTYIDANGNEVEALKNINIEIQPGEFISFIGPSGCGKTTLMRLIAGLDEAQEGELFLDGEKIEGTNHERGYVFQQANLFPWANIEDNISAGLRARKIYKEHKEEVAHYIEIAGLKGFEKSYPHQISGGMAQRASLVRALINSPKVLLLDEPLGALDSFTRFTLQDKLLELWKERETTMILVTHDVDEAVYLSDRIIIMSPRPGKIEEIINVKLRRPRNRTSDEFLVLRKKILEKLNLVSKSKDLEYYL